MSDPRAFNWDSIPVKVGNTADPAAGANPATVTVPAGKVWRVLSITQRMVSAVAAADRYPYVAYATGGGAVIAETSTANPQTASLTVDWSFTIGNYPSGLIQNNGVKCEPLMDMELPAGYTMNLIWLNIQGADNGGVLYYTYKERPA